MPKPNRRDAILRAVRGAVGPGGRALWEGAEAFPPEMGEGRGPLPSLYPISQGPRILASGPKLSHAQARSYIRCMPVHIV